jgi:hypothetical protein
MATVGVTATPYPVVSDSPRAGALQRVGGIVALAEGLFLAAFLALVFLVLPGLGFEASYFQDPPRFVEFIAAHYGLYFWTALIGVVIAGTLVLAVQALHERARAGAPALAGAAAAFGYVGAVALFLNWLFQYAAVRVAGSAPAVAVGYQQGAGVVFTMTNMGAFVALGVWAALLSWAALSRGGLPRALAYFGLLTGLADLLVLFDLPLGGILSAVWFVAVGAVLLLGRPSGAEA